MGEKKWIYALIVSIASLGVLATIAVLLQLSRREAEADAAELRTLLLEPRYEYRVVVYAAEGDLARTGEGAMKAALVQIDEKELTKLGSQGWEVIGSYLEMETAYPNFGDAKYVTGLQPNVRPQRLVLILRHRLG